MTWPIALGNFAGGRLWIESPVGTHPPPLPRNSAVKKLRGEYLDTKEAWICFVPQLYHAVEPVTSGVRVSLALFTPKGWKKLRPNCIDELINIGFCPSLPTLTTHPSQCNVASSSDTHVTTTSTLSGSVLERSPTASGSGPSTLQVHQLCPWQRAQVHQLCPFYGVQFHQPCSLHQVLFHQLCLPLRQTAWIILILLLCCLVLLLLRHTPLRSLSKRNG